MSTASRETCLGVLCAGCAQYIAVGPRRKERRDIFDAFCSETLECHRCGYAKLYSVVDLVERLLPRSLQRA
jgi:hypothetical protein